MGNALQATAAGWFSRPITDPIEVFAIVMLIVLIVPLLMQLGRLPSIVGLVVAGAIVGPGGLGLLEPDHGVVALLGAAGLLYLIFEAGVAAEPERFLHHRQSSALFGALTFSFPLLLGIAAALLLLGMNWPSAILLAAMFAAHTLVTLPIASRLGITASAAANTAVGGTTITDALVLLILAIVAGLHGGDFTGAAWLRLIAGVLALGVIVLPLVPRIGRWYFRSFSDGGVRDFVFVLATVFGTGLLARLAGIEPVAGAFLAGLALSRMIAVHGTLMSRIRFVGSAFFIPFFLILVGLTIDPAVLAEGAMWIVALVMIATALAAKYAAAQMTGSLLGFTPAERHVLFGLSAPHASITLAVAFIGAQTGVFGDAVLIGAVFMILATCLVGQWAVERSGRTLALTGTQRREEPGTAPLRILIPMANPASAMPLMDIAFMIRRTESPEPVYPIIVASETGDVRAQVAAGEQMLGHAVVHASSASGGPAGAGVPVVPVTYVDLDVASGISRAVKEHRISTIVIGWSGSAPLLHSRAPRVLLGSVLDRVLRDNPQTVMVCRVSAPVFQTKRLVLIVPRFIEREASFAEAVRTIKQLASRLKVDLLVLGSEVELKHLEPRIRKIRPQIDTECKPVASWSEIEAQLDREMRYDDLLVLLNSREGRLPWSPDLHRLPHALAQRFQRHNLVVVYPSELTAETAWFTSPTSALGAGAVTPAGLPALSSNRTVLGLAASDYEDAILEVVSGQFEDRPDTAREVRDSLVRGAREFATEVAPGVALLHAHVSHVTAPTFFLATSAKGIALPRTTRPAHVLLVLLSPREMPPELHLRALASVARLVRGPELVQQLLVAQSFHELRTILFSGSPPLRSDDS